MYKHTHTHTHTIYIYACTHTHTQILTISLLAFFFFLFGGGLSLLLLLLQLCTVISSFLRLAFKLFMSLVVNCLPVTLEMYSRTFFVFTPISISLYVSDKTLGVKDCLRFSGYMWPSIGWEWFRLIVRITIFCFSRSTDAAINAGQPIL